MAWWYKGRQESLQEDGQEDKLTKTTARVWASTPIIAHLRKILNLSQILVTHTLMNCATASSPRPATTTIKNWDCSSCLLDVISDFNLVPRRPLGTHVPPPAWWKQTGRTPRCYKTSGERGILSPISVSFIMQNNNKRSCISGWLLNLPGSDFLD